jgi:hypothetical protein
MTTKLAYTFQTENKYPDLLPLLWAGKDSCPYTRVPVPANNFITKEAKRWPTMVCNNNVTKQILITRVSDLAYDITRKIDRAVSDHGNFGEYFYFLTERETSFIHMESKRLELMKILEGAGYASEWYNLQYKNAKPEELDLGFPMLYASGPQGASTVPGMFLRIVWNPTAKSCVKSDSYLAGNMQVIKSEELPDYMLVPFTNVYEAANTHSAL